MGLRLREDERNRGETELPRQDKAGREGNETTEGGGIDSDTNGGV